MATPPAWPPPRRFSTSFLPACKIPRPSGSLPKASTRNPLPKSLVTCCCSGQSPTITRIFTACAAASSQLYEDAFGYLENGEGLLPGTHDPSYQGNMDIAVGRIPVHSAAEADAMVRKIQRYSARQYVPDDPTWRRQGNFGPWKNDLVFVGGQEFVGDMESWINQTMADADTLLDIHKIYSGFDTLRQAEARQKITAASYSICYKPKTAILSP